MEFYNNQEFLVRYRFSKATVLELLTMLPLHQNTDGRGCPVLPLLQLLVTLSFYGVGTFQVVSGDLVYVSQPTVSRVVTRVSTMIAATLFPALVKFPNAGKMREVMHQFYTKAKFPRVTGCIDCTHVCIKSSGRDAAKVFHNKKGYFSSTMQSCVKYVSLSVLSIFRCLRNQTCAKNKILPDSRTANTVATAAALAFAVQ
ncbi:hypothetical protein HPB49_022150 [Dermacentor silvarum]|uniref:Uncharacterized protein n=1 Tax=Dermacentor silvarum TaxID=543639 RepID=A0ACB8DG09_DERSI|nr:hypothetical protein HPB49_022150 [Dermacentor silvarum]